MFCQEMRLAKISQLNQKLPADYNIGWLEIHMDDIMFM